MPHRLGRDPFNHRNAVEAEIVSVPSILPRLTRKLYNKCIAAQRTLVEKLIQEYHSIKEVGCILAVRPNVAWKALLEELLDEEEVIYELIVDRVDEYEYRYFTRDLPYGFFDSITCARDDISDDGRPSTPDS